MHPLYSRRLKPRARELRKDGTKGEAYLWLRLRARQLRARFLRQRPIGPYIVDFLCPEANLIVEIDGRSHDDKGEYDLRREAYLKAQGYEVFTFTEAETVSDPDAVAECLWQWLSRKLVER